jgi:hypothetical protein
MDLTFDALRPEYEHARDTVNALGGLTLGGGDDRAEAFQAAQTRQASATARAARPWPWFVTKVVLTRRGWKPAQFH